MQVEFDHAHITQGGFHLRADFRLDGGSTAIIGPSGGGKSTLLLTIAGFLPLAAGVLRLGGTDMAGVAPGKRPVTLLFQENNLFAHLDVFRNTALGIRPDLKLDKAARERVHGALARVGLAGMEKRLPAALSGGQRQRVALARALLREKPVLLLDEPFAALGPALRHEMLDLVAQIRAEQDATLLMVTHNPDDARRIATRAILVADGRAERPVPTADLLDSPPPALAAYLGS